jgi:predicted metalloendopeptidase
MRATPLTIWALVLCNGAVGAEIASGPVFGPWGVTLAYLDPAVAPGTDFFRYANGSWVATARIPPDRQVAGVNLELDQGNEARLKTIVAALLEKPEAELKPEERKLRDLYTAFVDARTIEAAGLSPAQPTLARIAALRTHADVAEFLGAPATQSGGPYDIGVEIDEKNPEAYTVTLGQSGLGLPDRDYYLLKDRDSAATRKAYRKYLATMLAFTGVHNPARSAAVYALEERIAQVHWPAADRREADKVYNPMSLAELATLAPGFPWDPYFAAAGIPPEAPAGARRVVVREKSAFPRLAAVFAATPVSVWRDALTVRYLHGHAAELPQAVDDADFDFYGRVIGGQKQPLPRDLRGLRLLDGAMGEALGKLYVERYFPPEAKAKIQALVGNLLEAYAVDLDTLAWMTPETRARAREKIRRLTPKVGYPDRWRDYSELRIVPGEIVEDVDHATVFEWNRQLHRLDAPVDRGEWNMTPQTNNAYYDPTLNEIVFPAGILQPPNFDPKADDAANYGAIGAVIGHEISHGFDDQGSKYDASGRLDDWWNAEDRKNFDARTASLAKQYDAYEPLPGLNLNGRLTLGENIADLAGLVIAHKAYRIALGGREAPVLDGFTGDQRFYIAYAQSWREVWTEGLTRRVVLSNPHSPPAYRVNGVLRNDAGWYEAFPSVQPGAPLYLPPGERVSLW